MAFGTREHESVGKQVYADSDKQPEAGEDAGRTGDGAHDEGDDAAAADHNHEDTRGNLSVLAETLDGEVED